MQAETLEQAETILEKLDRGSLEAEMIVLKSRFEDEDARSRDLCGWYRCDEGKSNQPHPRGQLR